MIHSTPSKTIILFGALSTSVLMAVTPVDATYASRDISEQVNMSGKERFMYNKGFKDGYEVGKRKGYEDAYKKAMAAIQGYKRRIESYEAGKYLSRKGKITPPRVYQKRSGNGQFRVIVKGCELRGELSPSDILLLPPYAKEAESFGGSDRSSSGGSTTLSNGVFLSGIDHKKTPIAKPTDTLKQINSVVFRDTKFYRDLLRGAGVVFFIEENGGGLRATFSTPKEKENFIKSYNLVYGKDYK